MGEIPLERSVACAISKANEYRQHANRESPKLGEEELNKSVAAEVAKLREMAGQAEVQLVPGGRDGAHREVLLSDINPSKSKEFVFVLPNTLRQHRTVHV